MQKRAIHAVLPLAALAVFIIATSRTAIAQSTMQFPVERDAGILAWDNHDGYGNPPVFDPSLETEEFSNHGWRTTIRGKKGTQHAAIMDWNTDEINAFIETNVDTSQPVAWTLNVYPAGEEPNDDVQIETLESLNDWVEGDGGFFDYGTGGEFTNFNWSPDSQAATTNFAQTLHLIDGELIGIPWIDNDFGTGGIDDNQYSILGRADNFSTGLRIPDHINSELLTQVDLSDALFDSTYASVPLDDELIAELLGDPDNRGIIFGNNSAGENWQIYTRDGDGQEGSTQPIDPELRPGPKAPFLEIAYTPKQATTSADFNSDGAIDLLDIDLLYVELKSGGNDPGFDLDGNGLVDDADLRVWLTDAGAARGFGPIPPGDTNLDGLVNATDLNSLGVNWQSMSSMSWGEGDFNYDSSINAADLNDLGVNWLSDVTAGAAATVPEPTSALLLIVGIAMWAGRRRMCVK